MPIFESANRSITKQTGRLIYYIIIDGKSEYSVSFSYHKEPPDIWVRIQRKLTYFAVMYEGVYFMVYDSEPFTEKEMVYALFDDVLMREGLYGQ